MCAQYLPASSLGHRYQCSQLQFQSHSQTKQLVRMDRDWQPPEHQLIKQPVALSAECYESPDIQHVPTTIAQLRPLHACSPYLSVQSHALTDPANGLHCRGPPECLRESDTPVGHSHRLATFQLTAGCRLLTRPPRISGNPVCSATSVTATFSARRASAVPPDESPNGCVFRWLESAHR